ncbi:BTB/POZ domain-containing protein [Rhynchospora pubera]|uniref:BTB/POZ domain-containing protein n=1 Tax=Rhynchospora pubera TaxID=906938 RepID=A0AAV8F3T5_9POAL|nr:BTB/POZ domain-containing protein [Rhynchospora pubera]
MSYHQFKIGDRTTSDVVVRVRTDEGRDYRLYCHSRVLSENSDYFGERLSNEWPTCQILDPRYCVDVQCTESEFNSYVNAIRLIYKPQPCHWYGVRGTLGILLASVHLGLHKITLSCADYLESAPWDEADEEEILRAVPPLGPKFERILSRLQLVDLPQVSQIFLSAFCFATSAPNKLKTELKKCYQDQIEYLLTEDDDLPLISITNNEHPKRELKKCVVNLFEYFGKLVEKDARLGIDQEFSVVLSDILWVCQILTKLDMMGVIVPFWVDMSPKIEKLVDVFVGNESEIRLKVVEITSKVLEAMNFGNVVLPPEKRFDLVKTWIPILQRTKDWIEEKNDESFDGEILQTLESSIVSVILTLPSDWQAEILSQWFASKHVQYPDLLEVFEVWSYRAKSAKRRFF